MSESVSEPGSEQPLTVIIAGPPTANGDLHVGHVAGPYVGGDVHARYLRATGRPVVWASCTDDMQTYVVTTAKRLGTTPPELVARSSELIRTTFEAMGIALDGFSPTDDGYRALVYDYVQRLYDAGKFKLRTVRLPYGERSGKFLVEGFVGGACPTCLDDSRGGFCETCGHPIDFDGLIEPYSILDPGEPVTYREARILVFPMEEYRQRLIAYHAERAGRWRPHVVTLMREILAKPLPDYPITYPVEWGWPAPWPEVEGQTLNAWLDGMPASIYCTGWAQRQRGDGTGEEIGAVDDAWRAERGARAVVFMGFDPLYVWGLVHIAELMAHEGRYALTDTLHINEFYELEHEKFSTSKGHVVWARDLVAEVPRDVVRFYLCVSAPEHARTNFSRATLDKIAGERLVTPWNELAADLAKLTAEAGGDPLPVSAQAPVFAAAIVDRFASCYELDSFSLARAADLIVQHTGRLRTLAARTLAAGLDADALRERVGDLFLQARALVSGASPILADLAERAGVPIAFDAGAYRVTHTGAFTLPGLDLRTAGAAG
ncbi:class I tRNA ligase family protein [Dactylosporangium sp. NPDC048998]|uniref:class I tRNA ligase family protein n=1 Tax=Dactylosporangium sp. NPDC048998 TaxID=3363976 RepID=UPI00371E4A82